jgi:hypothetical protein
MFTRFWHAARDDIEVNGRLWLYFGSGRPAGRINEK